MPEIVIAPATADRFADVEAALTGGGDGAGCQCQWWMLTNADFHRLSRDEREGMLRDELDAPVPPGLVATVDGEPAGWVRVGPRTRHVRLPRTRAIAPFSPEPWDDPDVWAISCFSIRREHRGLGLARALLAAAVDHAREHGARAIEGYPVDTADAPKTSSAELYHGTVAMFEDAGFQVIPAAKPARPLVGRRI